MQQIITPMNPLHFELSLCQTKELADRKLAKAQLILDYNSGFYNLVQWVLFFSKMPWLQTH